MAVEIQAAHRGEATLITKDEHLRATTLGKLTNVPAHFRKDRTVTVGNASGINDVARAILLASAKAVKDHNLVPPARVGFSTSSGLRHGLWALVTLCVGVGQGVALALQRR